MTGPTTQEYQPLSQALQFQNQQPELPRLQLAPPEHQKQLQAASQVKQQPETRQQPQSSTSPTTQQPDDHATSISSSREVSPAIGLEPSPTTNGQKRKSIPSKEASTKKRKTDQTHEQGNGASGHYDAIGTHYPYNYSYPGATPLPPFPGFHSPRAGSASADMSFNEFQWRLLNLCGEFYEAATELIRSTPHLVLSQAFQILDRGTGLDPITVLNDARRTCDMLLTNPQALSRAPPPPAALSLPALTSLAHLNARPSSTSMTESASARVNTISPPSYYPPQSASLVVENFNPKNKEKERAPNNVQGTWKDEEIQKLKSLAEKYKMADKPVAEEEEEEGDVPAGEGNEEDVDGESAPKPSKKPKTSETSEVDWDKVIEEFGDGRSRHQVLIKATYLGLKPSSSLPGKKPKRKKTVSAASLPPPLTFSSSSTRSVPTGYSPPEVGNTQSSTATTSAAVSIATPAAAPSKQPAVSAANDSYKTTTAPPLPVPPQHHPHAHAPYGQPGWYPHPQNPYYPYQPMYYSPHPQGYGIQGYGIQPPPPQGYYPPPYVPPPGTEVPSAEKQTQPRGKRKDSQKDDTSTTTANATPVPPPSLPPKAPPADMTSSTKSTPTSSAPALKPAEVPASGSPVPQSAPNLPSTNTPTAGGSSGVLRRGPNNSLFTYTPLPHGSGAALTEQSKEA